MTTLKGVFPDPKPVRRKNFIQENVKNLRRMEQCFHTNRGVEELQKLQLQRHQKVADKYQNVSAKVNTSLHEKKHDDNNADSIANKKEEAERREPCRKCSAPNLNKNVSGKKISNSSTNNNIQPSKQKKRERKGSEKSAQKLQGKVLSDPNFSRKPLTEVDNRTKTYATKYKNQGIQTLDTKQMDNLYSEGMIRYPSKKCLRQNETANKHETTHLSNNTPRDATNPPSDRGDVQISEDAHDRSVSRSPDLSTPKEEIDFVKLNKERTSVASRMAAQLNNNNAPPTNYRKGVVPKYIRERKEAHEKEQKAKAEASDPDCPEGHVPLPDNERKETLRMLKKNYQEYVNELNMMPIKTDTLRAQRRKMEIEKQLNKLEEGIKVFSRPKVYVKVNA